MMHGIPLVCTSKGLNDGMNRRHHHKSDRVYLHLKRCLVWIMTEIRVYPLYY